MASRGRRAGRIVAAGSILLLVFFLGRLTLTAGGSDGASLSGPTDRQELAGVAMPSQEDLLHFLHYGKPESPEMKAMALQVIGYFDPVMMSLVEDDVVMSRLQLGITCVGRCPSLTQAAPFIEECLKIPNRKVLRSARYYYPKVNPLWQKDPRTRALMEAAIQ